MTKEIENQIALDWANRVLMHSYAYSVAEMAAARLVIAALPHEPDPVEECCIALRSRDMARTPYAQIVRVVIARYRELGCPELPKEK
jgi:hypothetical protein